MTAPADVLTAARLYRSRGLSLLPLAPRSKDPHALLLPLDADGRPSWSEFIRRPASEAEIRCWVSDDPECNLGIMTGSVSGGVVAADFDGKAPGLPVTPMARTRRGFHAYFVTNDSISCSRQAWGDFRGDGGYVVAPPSIHPSGDRYQWFDGLGFWETDLAPLPLQLLGMAERKRGRKQPEETVRKFETAADEGDSLGVARNSVSCFSGSAVDGEGVLGLCASPEVALAVMRQCGCAVDRIGRSFLCPLPGHEEKTPSASLWHQPGRPVRLRCFHEDEWWSMPDVFAVLTTGKLRRLGRGERALWWIRALHETGVMRAPAIAPTPLPGNAPAAVRKLYEGFCLAVRLRAVYSTGQAGTPFSWRFAAHWCGIGSPATVSGGMKWLLGHGYLRRVQEGPAAERGACRTTLLALGAGSERHSHGGG